jgi:formate hydrogenlyase transcriptional activator
MGRHIERVPRAAMDALQRYHWPGNVRELQNVVERAMIRSTGDVLEIDESFDAGRRPAMVQASDRTLAAVERAHITAVLDECGWRINGPGGAAEMLALNPNTLRFRMKKLAIDRSSDRKIAKPPDV